MFEERLKGRILFIFSDPGGAKPCLALADAVGVNALVLSDRDYPFYKDFQCSVKLISKSYTYLEEIIHNFRPDLIFTGTSYTSNIENSAISIGKKSGVSTTSLVDHWTSISDRFKTDSGYNFPNEVWVMDHNAQQTAINEGIDKKSIYISGNPYHIWLAKWRPKRSKKLFLKKTIEIDPKKKIVLFAPDPLSNVNGLNTYGFDEYTSSRQIIDCVENCSEKEKESFQILVKLHPNQKTEPIQRIFKGAQNFSILPPLVDLNEYLFFSDLVIGFFSSVLIEASVMNRLVIRFLVKEAKNDPFLSLNLGVIANEDNLINSMLKLIKDK